MVITHRGNATRMGHRSRGPRILIAGLGNVLLRDDGVGVHAIKELQKDPPPRVLVVEVGTAVLDALHLCEWADKILVMDAMQADNPPGTIYVFRTGDGEGRDLQASLHELGFLEALKLLPNRVKAEIVVLGIEPEVIDYGIDLSPTLQAMMPLILQGVKSVVAHWRKTQPLPNPPPYLSEISEGAESCPDF